MKWLIVFTLFVFLVLVRAFEAKLFYDPLIMHFKYHYLYEALPEFNTLKLFFNVFLRYVLNTIISLGIIYVIFKNKRLIKFSIKFYFVAFIVMSLVYYVLLSTEIMNDQWLTFYVRRFLIHPLFVLILVPAFYYQKMLVKQSI
jgi:exosortase F-associated protein